MIHFKPNLPRIFYCLTLFSLFGCATYETHYDEDKSNLNTSLNKETKNDLSIYLIGDAGGAEKGKSLSHFESLKSKLALEETNSLVIFLGDNVYEKGMPKKDHHSRNLAEHRIDAQLDLVKNFDGRTIFIPGNHDYYSNGSKGLKKQAKYIEKKTGAKDVFLPKNGCPIKNVRLNDEVVLIVIDSQWYLEDWDKHPNKNDDCDIKTREEFFNEFESLVKKNATKTTIVALHHPLFSGGPHGGQFKFSPFSAIPNLLRKTSGASLQDQQNPIYRVFTKRLMTIAQNGEKLVFISGHEHVLEYLEKNNTTQIISGSGSKKSASRNVYGSKFAMSDFGYAKLNIFQNGDSQVDFYKATSSDDHLVYSKNIYASDSLKEKYMNAQSFDPTTVSSVYSKEEVRKGKAYKMLWGKHYRKYFGTDIIAPTATLDTLKGGLTPVRKGGGHQSNSLRLEDKNGKEYMIRALKKNPIKFMQSGMFRDQYIASKYNDTYTEDVLLDVFTTAHPYAPLTVGPLLDAVDIYHPNTSLYYIPKQSGLEKYNDEFGDELYFLEERAASGHGDKKNFGFSDEIISTDDLFVNLRESDDNILDEKTFIRARLMDMLIGDWDRHKDQWRWAEFKDGKKTIYKPVPRDRDQAYSKYDGFLMEFTTRILPPAKKLQVYDDEIRSVKWFNANPFPVDKTLISRSSIKDWIEQAEFIQEKITDEVIEEAFSMLPAEIQDETIDKIKSIMKKRLA